MNITAPKHPQTLQFARHQAFTLVELLVVITIIAILASVSFPVYSTVQERARATEEMNNIRQMAMGLNLYTTDSDGGVFSDGENWAQVLHDTKLKVDKIFKSPFDRRSSGTSPIPVSYGINGAILYQNLDDAKYPSQLIAFAPYFTGTTVKSATAYTGTMAAPGSVTQSTLKTGTHSGGKLVCVSFADAHVESMQFTKFIGTQSSMSAEDKKRMWELIVSEE